MNDLAGHLLHYSGHLSGDSRLLVIPPTSMNKKFVLKLRELRTGCLWSRKQSLPIALPQIQIIANTFCWPKSCVEHFSLTQTNDMDEMMRRQLMVNCAGGKAGIELLSRSL